MTDAEHRPPMTLPPAQAAHPARSAVGRRAPLLLIANPRASRASEDRIELAAALLSRRYNVDVARTRAPGDGLELARAAPAGRYALVAVLGGDGTVNEVANVLALTRTPLACLPGGRSNVLARSVGMPTASVEAAARFLARPGPLRTRRIDLGEMNERYFTFASGVGLSASINRRVDRRPGLKSRLGAGYLAYAVMSTLGGEYRRSPPAVRLSVGDHVAEGVTVVVQNSDPLTYLGRRAVRVCEGAGPTTGTLSVALLRRSSGRDVATVAARIASGKPSRVLRHRSVRGFAGVAGARVGSIDGRPLPVEVDGEHVGEVDSVLYGIAPAALAIVV